MRHKLPLATAEAVRRRAETFAKALQLAPESRLLRTQQSLPEGIWGFEAMRKKLPDLKHRFVDNLQFSGLCKLLEQDLGDIERVNRDLSENVATLRNLANDLELAYETTLRELSLALPAIARTDPLVSQLINPDPRHIPAKQTYDQQFEATLAGFAPLAKALQDRTHQATMKFTTLIAAIDCRVCPGTKRARAKGDTKDMIDYVVEARRANPTKERGEVYEIAKRKFHQRFDETFLARSYVINEWPTLVGF